MSNAAIGCLSFGARADDCRAFVRVESVHKRLETICVRVASFLRGTQTVREAFSWLPDVVGRSNNV